jgi:PST family polysaccharide transporter
MSTAAENKQQPQYSVAARSAKGGAFLLFRQAAVQGMNFIGIIFLARYLSIAEYGFFGIIFFLFSFITNFGDIGFSASLLRQREEPALKDYSSVFTAQLALAAGVGVIFYTLSPLLCTLYKLPPEYTIHFLLISLSLIVTAFRSAPTARLERHLDFKWLSIIEVIQSAVYNVMAAAMAFYGYGPLSFSLALLCRALIGTILVNTVSHTPLRLNFDMALIKKHLAFGLPYQAGIFVNVLKDSISPVIIGLFLGAAKTGMVNMACTIAGFPTLLMVILNRLFFPAFSRAINDKAALEKLFRISIRLSNAFVAPLAIFVLIMAEPFTLHVFGDKWVGEATDYSYLLWPTNLFMPTLMVCTCLLNAFGRSKTVLKFNVLWMLLTLGLGTPLIFAFGAKGFGYANIVVIITTVIVPITLRKYINCRVFKEQFTGWLPAVVLAGIPVAFSRLFIADKLHLILNIVFYYAAAATLTYFLCRKDIQPIIKNLLTPNKKPL